ncbi:MAG: histidine kinase [Ferruginibacter sp.]
MKRICCILFLLPFAAIAQQQTGHFMAYGNETRYLSGINSKVYQSRSGYLWICSGNGLIRFDGKRYSIFSADHANPNSLTDNIIFDVTEDRNGDLWIAGFTKGVTRYNQRTGVFRKYPAPCSDGNPVFGINRIVNDAAQDIWLATAGRGLALYDFKKDTFQFFYPEPNGAIDGTVRGDNFVTDIVQDPFNTDHLWVGSFHGLYLFDKRSRIFHRYACTDSVAQKDILVSDLEIQPSGTLWIGTWGKGMFCFDTQKKIFSKTVIPAFAYVVYDIKAINEHTLYTACLSAGMYEYDIARNTARNITPYGTGETNNNADIQRISVTPTAGIFAGGKFHIYQEHDYYRRLQKNIFFTGAGAADATLMDIIWDGWRKIYWVCTNSALYSLPRHSTQLQLYGAGTPVKEGEYFIDIAADAQHTVWALCRNRGLLQYNDAKKDFELARAFPLADSSLQKMRRIATDSSGALWLFGADSMYRYQPADRRLQRFALAWEKDYPGRHIISGPLLLAAPHNTMWLLSQQGIFIFNANGFVKHIYKTGSGKDDLASRIVMTGAFNTATHSFWFTSGDGLQVMNYDKYDILSTHYLEQGLPANTIRGVAIDSLGKVWLASTAGVGHFNPAVKIWRNFNRLDGLENDYLDNNVYALPNRMIAVPQNGGFAFYADSVFLIADSARLRITSLLVNNKEYADSVLPEFIHELQLPYDQNNITIEYAAMDWIYPFKTSYRYKIEGVKGLDTWLPNDEASLHLAGLQPGKYKLHLKAISSGGSWSNEVILPITIRSPYWKTWWFIGLVLLAAGFIIYRLFKYRVDQLKKMQAMRNSISRDLHDDIGASLSNIGILNELAKRNLEDDTAKAGEYLGRAAEDIQHISQNLGDIVWNINPQFDNINDLFIRMKRYAADMAEGKNIECSFEMPENPEIALSMDKRRDFYLLYKEAINNMVKHSQATHAFIKITLTASQLQLLVKDDGTGFDENDVAGGNGLSNMRQRAAQLNGTLRIHTAALKGTELLFIMPL